MVSLGLTWHKVNCQFVVGMHGDAMVIIFHQLAGLEAVVFWRAGLTVV